MTKRITRRVYITIGVVVLGCLLLFRLEILFAFQRSRLTRLGCGERDRVSLSTTIDKLPACEKLWAHRVDSYNRFNYLKDHFSGLETDVVFDTTINDFWICHPPAKPIGLVLQTYFKDLKAGSKGLWIDVKDIDSSAYKQAVDYFLTCDHLYNVKKFVIIESSEIRFINLLADHGFVTSYLVPLQYLQPTTSVEAVDSLNKQLSPAVKFVSQEDTHLPVLKTRFKSRKIITWAISFKNYFHLSYFRSLINDTAISVVLINCKSKGYL